MRMFRWICFLALGTLGFSCGFGCAVPLAAFGAVAALTLRPGAAAGAVTLVWLINQVWQVAALDVPLDAGALRWAAGLFALAQVCAAAPRVLAFGAPAAVRAVGCFALAFGVYEGGLAALAGMLGGGAHAFTAAAVGSALGVNAIVFAVLLAASLLQFPGRSAAGRIQAA